MSWICLALLLSGWIIAVASLLLLPALGQRLAFVLAALCVEVLGLALLARANMLRQRDSGPASGARR